MHFSYPYLLIAELLIPLLVLFYIYSINRKNKSLDDFGQRELISRLSSASARRQHIKFCMLASALFFFIFAAARPQFGTKLVQLNTSGADVVIAVDVSGSMLAQDIKPSRLEKAKALMAQLAQQLEGNRIGVIAFAGTAFWQCPLTLDISSVNLFLQIMDTNIIPLPGTTIGNAIRLASDGLSKTAPKSKAIVLLTDGEDHNSDPLAAAKAAAGQGIKIYTVGFGNPAGEPIPNNDESGNFKDYKKNKKGEVVMSKLDETLLSKISEATGGQYFKAQDGELDVGRLSDEIRGLEKQKLSSNLNRLLEDRYQYFVLIGLILLMAEFVIPSRKKS